MKKYTVNIKETLTRVVEVDASSAEEAMDIVDDMYWNEQIVLDYNDFVGKPEIEVLWSNEKRIEKIKKMELLKRIEEVYATDPDEIRAILDYEDGLELSLLDYQYVALQGLNYNVKDEEYDDMLEKYMTES